MRPCASTRRTTSAPTVPSPAIPTFKGSSIPANSFTGNSTPVGERNHVVQRFNAAFKEAAHAAGGLADTLLIFDHGDAHITLAVLAEGDPGRHHHTGFLHHQGGKLHAADVAESLRQRRPGEHRGFRRR